MHKDSPIHRYLKSPRGITTPHGVADALRDIDWQSAIGGEPTEDQLHQARELIEGMQPTEE